MSKHEFLRAVDSINFYRHGNLRIKYSKYLNLDKVKKSEFLKSLNKDDLQVEIIAFCLMENHFHFLLKQLKDNGIVKFMAKFTNSYTKYFNTKHKRVGPLFQGIFKAVYVENDEQFLHLSRYIHLNPVTGFVIESSRLKDYQWSSYPDYMGLSESGMVNTSEILGFFKSSTDYEQFVLDQEEYAKKLKLIEHLTIE